MKPFLDRAIREMQRFWLGVRQWSGDAAYESYVACATKSPEKVPLSEAEFYVEHLNRKYSRPNRCC